MNDKKVTHVVVAGMMFHVIGDRISVLNKIALNHPGFDTRFVDFEILSMDDEAKVLPLTVNRHKIDWVGYEHDRPGPTAKINPGSMIPAGSVVEIG